MSYPACIRVRNRDVSEEIYALPVSSVKTWPGLQGRLHELFPDQSLPFKVTVGQTKDVIHQNVWRLFVTNTLLVDVESTKAYKFVVIVEDVASGREDTFQVSSRMKLAKLRDASAQFFGKDPCSIRLLHDCERTVLDQTFGDMGVGNGAKFQLMTEQKGGKPVITCYPLATTDLEVGLSLSSGLDFSYVHPLPSGSLVSDIGAARNVAWKVTAKPNGELVDTATKRTYAQLFWEATQLTGASVLPAPIDTSMADATTVFMTTPDLFPTFIDDLMIRLGFQVKERQEFVTYWGPQLLEKPIILMKLLSQGEYDNAAALSVKPRPDRVVRLFAVFRGVTVSEMNDEGLRAAGDMDVEVALLLRGRPAPRVGSVEDGFVVFEWGGMIA